MTMKHILISLFSILSFTVYAQESITFVGHRGASYLAPENTVESISLAWELGAKAAECDIMLTKDKEVIVFHDKKGKRLTNHNFVVKDVNYNEIKDYPINLIETNLPKYQGATIPLLKDVLTTIPNDRTLVIEIKTGPEILPFMKEILDKHWNTGNIAFIAFDFETIIATKDLYPKIPCYYLSMFKSELNNKYKQIRDSNLDGVNLRYKIIDENLVRKYKVAGKDIWCWTVNTPEDAQHMIELGVSAITTDRPVWLQNSISPSE